MKKTVSFRLSENTTQILNKKSHILNISKTQLLESIVQDLIPSTSEEIFLQKKNREQAFVEFVKMQEVCNSFTEKAWKNGFKEGWQQFQIRKLSSPFRLSKNEETLNWMKGKLLK